MIVLNEVIKVMPEHPLDVAAKQNGIWINRTRDAFDDYRSEAIKKIEGLRK